MNADLRRAPGERFYKAACAVCQRDFTARIDRPQKYCSHACAGIGMTKPRPRCERCGAERSDRKHPTRRFCGHKCAVEAATKDRPTCHVCGVQIGRGAVACTAHKHAAVRMKRLRKCVGCEKEYIPFASALARGNKFCSLSCYRQSAALRPAMLTLACEQCGGTFRRTTGAIKRASHSFCSHVCAMTFRTRDNHPAWRGGCVTYRGAGWTRIAEAIRLRDGYRCRRCGKHQDLEVTRLSVDHIIPFRTFATPDEANLPSNLVALCRSCHSKKTRAENRWIEGDVLDMWTYQIAVAEPWTRL